MSGQEQLKLKKSKPAGGGDDTGDGDLRGELPDIAQLMKKINHVKNKRESNCSDDAGYCEWSNICNFEDCPRR